jgi:hypothetical protein
MRISKRNPIFIAVSILTFALGVFVTPRLELPNGFRRENVLVLRQSPWKLLLSFENQDLLGLDEPRKRMIEGAVVAITGQRHENPIGRFEPALFRTIVNTQGEKRYILVELAQIAIIPGNSSLRVYVFDPAGSLLNSQEFNAGYRTAITSMRVRDNEIVPQPLLIVEAEYCLGGHPSTQYYALTSDRVELVYLEQDGRVDRNAYLSHMSVGPQLERSVDELEKALGSSEEVEVLSALVWYNTNPPLPKHATVQNRLRELSQSENYFIKRAAHLVLENSK